jgi:hypothetical protein
MIRSTLRHRSKDIIRRLLAGLLLAAGIVPTAYGDGWAPWPFNKEEKPGKPTKIVPLWNDTVLTQTGRPQTRGFGGRIMFYEGQKEEPIKVEGTLVIYAFDETDRDANNSKPDRKYVFTPAQLPQHYSKTKVGHSYSVWLPWDEVGGLQKEITLIVRMQSKEGDVAVSDASRQLLPGRIVAPPPARSPVANVGMLPATGNDGAQPVAYQAPVDAGTGVITAAWQQRHMTTTTIPLPSTSVIRTAVTSPQVGGGYSQPGQGPAAPGLAVSNYPPRNYPQGQPQNLQPQNPSASGHIPPSAPSAASPGRQFQSGYVPGRQWPLGAPLVPQGRDRALWQPHLVGSQFGPASQPGQAPANAGQAALPGVPQSPN